MAKRRSTKSRKYDVTKHGLVPKHSKLSQKETKAVFDRYNITIKELPKILVNDPAIKGLGVKDGDIIRIERNSPTSGYTVYYRGVVSG